MFRVLTARSRLIRRLAAIAFAAALLAPVACAAQGFDFPAGALVTAEMSHSFSVFHPGSTGFVAITADIAAGWHINADKPLESYLIPTVLEVNAPAGIEIVRILYPAPHLTKLDISEAKMALYDGVVVFGAVIRIGPDVQPGPYRLTATIRYQGCNNLTCVEPSSASAADTIRVGTLDEGVEQLHTGIFSKPPFAGEGETAARVEAAPSDGRDIGTMIAERGLVLTFVFIFFIGLGLSLTPCIYPLIPITVSYFGGQAGGRASRTFLLALLYVLGMSLTYSVLGTIAAMTGGLFGAALQNPFVVLVIAAILVALALSMFGFWEIRMPAFLQRRTGSAKQGYAGALFMGLTMGIIAAPCIGPFVLGLLTYVGEMGKPVLGFFMFFTLAWGIGLPFLVLGTISGSIARLPRSGDWMVWVRKIFGFVLVAMALYFARHLLSPRLVSIGYAAIAIAGGVYLGWIDRAAGKGRGFSILKRAVGVLGVAIGAAFLLLPALRGGDEGKPQGIAWQPFSEEAVLAAAREGKPVVIDFSAAWCLPCHELDAKTFSDAEVVKLSAGFVPLRVDLTKSGELETKIKNDYKVRGVPAIIFIDGAGREHVDLRATGFIDAAEFARRVRELPARPAAGAPPAGEATGK